jgi:hypothetical protein
VHTNRDQHRTLVLIKLFRNFETKLWHVEGEKTRAHVRQTELAISSKNK